MAADRGRGQAAPLSADGLAAILATAERPRTDGRGVESHTTAQRRGRTDAVIAGLLFMGGLRRSEVSALEWRDVADASDGDALPTDRVIGLAPLQIQRRFTAAAAGRRLPAPVLQSTPAAAARPGGENVPTPWSSRAWMTYSSACLTNRGHREIPRF